MLTSNSSHQTVTIKSLRENWFLQSSTELKGAVQRAKWPFGSLGWERHCLKDSVGTRLYMGCQFKLGSRGRIVNSGRAVF